MLTDTDIRLHKMLDDPAAREQLRRRVVRAINRNLCGRKGTCDAGHRVYIDDYGVYSTGDIVHIDSGTMCRHGHGVLWDDWTDHQKRLIALLESL